MLHNLIFFLHFLSWDFDLRTKSYFVIVSSFLKTLDFNFKKIFFIKKTCCSASVLFKKRFRINSIRVAIMQCYLSSEFQLLKMRLCKTILSILVASKFCADVITHRLRNILVLRETQFVRIGRVTKIHLLLILH